MLPNSPVRHHSPDITLNQQNKDFQLFTSTTPQTFNADFELFGPADPTPRRNEHLSSTSRAIPELTSSVNDAVFNLGYTTSLPANRAFVSSTPANSLVQRSPFVNTAEFNPALIEALSDNHRARLIRGNSNTPSHSLDSNNISDNTHDHVNRLPPLLNPIILPPITAVLDSLEPVLQQDIDMYLDLDSPSSLVSSDSSSFSSESPLNNNPPSDLSTPADLAKRQRNMEEELMSLVALEASPFHANDMTFSPNGQLFHDFSPFIGTLHTGRTNDTLDDSSPMDTPLFGLEDGITDEWPTLFPTEDANPSSSTDILVNPAALMIGGELSTPPLTAIVPSRQFSTDSNKSRTPPSPPTKSRPTSTAQKRSSLTGVSRRKAAADLPPVQFDPSNPIDIKRARNTMAARKSRARRVEKMDELAEAVEKLQAEAQRLKEEKEFYKNLARQHGALVD
ncbi:hypothetical protein TWF730_008171 [Orbilia blumenaviensis]|uniref:BZIP domain-containing protein n=1 Tax=Orbilia blumenaviensis TaxID=1796055 RepID=A0AAV9V5E4_9PEZI